ncbi:divergent polysaccharide deacetylase family protein [Azospirillum sp. A1-3]|uniref:divergent polysaccharide deacetylase family protein n=1 Tax=unclassified Azospirillum TaxID=2630922 RepID=UPI0010A9965D|nr:divergent polysaccharide deacetylase family protein [Azospirillum sp. TSA2s]MCM8734433.1 divergent polysaccharide deacetylase family protein [Azospirillum sp. A1-3]QCG97053.1 divergent polysaccharide deacetylase family protein [Azospirillum sp. TSA2s]
MKAPALLGRLRFDVRGLRPGLGWLRRFRRNGGDSAGRPRKPLSKPLLAAVALVAVAGGGLAGWLALNGEATREAWQASIPAATVAVAPLPPPPVPEPKAAAPAAPLPTDAAPLPLPGVPAAAVTLVPAPVPGLVEDSRNGPLPRIAQDGRKPWQVYARPFPATDKRPRIAIVMSDLGLSGVTTGNALAKLPPGITLAFLPYAERLDDWVERARTKGHEVMLSVPMEPLNYPRDDPGPNALLTMLGPDRNVERLEWSLGKAVGYVGITSTTGSKFTANPAAMQPVIDVLKARGLLLVDSRVNPKSVAGPLANLAGVPRALGDRVIDRDLSRGAIDDQLRELEELAKTNGAAVGFASPYPTTIERLNLWLTSLADRGIALAPASAVVNIQK